MLSSAVLGLYAFGVNWTTNYFRLNPPGSFFFIMIGSMASCMPFDPASIPSRIGILTMGTLLACVFALIYGLIMNKKNEEPSPVATVRKMNYTNIKESLIIGLFICLSLLTGHLFQFENPYWIPISCLAVMQGMNVENVGRRSFHRILGTFAGMGLTWILLQLNLSPLNIILSILVLQFLVEVIIVRNYVIAVIFMTPMTLFLVELGRNWKIDTNELIMARMIDIIVGSLIGVLGGWFLHNQHLHRQIRRTRISLLRK
jgi:hypothetical protein